MKRDFEHWLSQLKVSIENYQYYVDFEKILRNIDEIKIELNILNSLIGSENIESEFRRIISKYPEVLKCIPILLAVRNDEIYITEENKTLLYSFNKTNHSSEKYVEFMRKTGLFDIFQKGLTKNLLDYVLEIEVGLDSHGRKNRVGMLMEKIVEDHIIRVGLIKNKDYFKREKLLDVIEKLKISVKQNSLLEEEFNFIVNTSNMIYAIKTNFFGSLGGSKLSEIAKNYKTLSLEAKEIENLTFVWITDGKGWNSSKKFLEETFDLMETIFNIYELENGALTNLFS
ncbi:type II restriction endonuclease [Mycoplasma suis]|nr:type II restriction endonuclease [Mycoplasma suis]